MKTEESSKPPEISESEKPESLVKFFPSENGGFKIPGGQKSISQSDFYHRVRSSRVVVIGIFGKTRISDEPLGKAYLFDDLMQRDVFRIADQNVGDDDDVTQNPNETSIYGFHDERSGRIFLHLSAPSFDARALTSSLSGNESDKDFRTVVSSQEFKDAKLLLLMFHVCHILVCYIPGHTIDLSYVPLFQALDTVRLKFHSVLGEHLQSLKLNLNKDWLNHGRLAQPRLLFYFASCPTGLRGSKGTSELLKRDGTVSKHTPIKKLEFSLEDQIFRILRRARIASSSSNNCLFSLPTRDGYVYVNNGSEDGYFGDLTLNRINHLLKTLDGKSEQGDSNGPFVPYFYQQTMLESRTSSRCFETFLTAQIESLSSKSSSTSSSTENSMDGSTGRNTVELPTSAQWYDGISGLFPVFGSNPTAFTSPDLSNSSTNSDVLKRGSNLLAAYTDIEIRFSEARCAKALPVAVAAYKEGLQSHYLEEYHNAKLMQAMALFSLQARGPESASFAEKLAAECTSYWQSGRQMCEELSLTGHHCVNRKHLTNEGQAKKEEMESTQGIESPVNSSGKKILPTMSHISEVVFLSACNCGRRQADREDPFALVEANHKFYAEISEDCCNALEHIEVPVFQAQTSSKVLTSNVVESSSMKSKVSTAADDLASRDVDAKEKLQNLATLATKTQASTNQQTSAEFTQTMVTKTTRPGVLPTFPSWALTQLGSAHLYAHSSGVNQPGFMSGTKSLLSWDVPLKNVEWNILQDKWPNLADYAVKKSTFNKNAKGLEMGLTVKVFVGIEYECPRGHRFISASPEKAVKPKNASSSSAAAAKLVSSDIPLYMPCPCRASTPSRPFVAQLMRCHIVTPKAPVYVTLAPRVVPCPDGPVFLPGWAQPVKLPINSYWVLRFPYIYQGEAGSHIPPKEAPPLSYGRLLKGFIGINEDFEYK